MAVYRAEMARGCGSHSFIQEIQPAMNRINSFISEVRDIALPCKCFQKHGNAILLIVAERGEGGFDRCTGTSKLGFDGRRITVLQR